MKIECILELMQDKDYIEIEENTREPMPLTYIIRNSRGKEFGSKLFHIISESEDYIADHGNINFPEIFFAKKADIDEWLEIFTEETKKITWLRGRLDTELFKYMEKKGFEASYINCSGRAITITNLKIKNERLRKIEEKNQEAIDLLDQLL